MHGEFLASDFYSPEVQFTFKGKKRFHSDLGIWFSWVVRLLTFLLLLCFALICYFYAERQLVVNSSETVISSTGSFNMHEQEFDFVVGFNKFMNKKYGSFVIVLEDYKSGYLMS